jgi:beta-lactamase superfamily II metal-dependent hydrolase
VLAVLQSTNLYRTDLHGTVEIATDGKQLWISTSRQQR